MTNPLRAVRPRTRSPIERLTEAGDSAELASASSPLCDDREAFDFPALKGAQEDVVGLEGHATVGIAIRAQHVGMREQPNAIEGEPTADGIQSQRLNPMKKRFAQRELIDARGRRAVIALIHETGSSILSPRPEWASRRLPSGR